MNFNLEISVSCLQPQTKFTYKILAKSVNLPVRPDPTFMNHRSWSFLRFSPQKMIIQEDLGRKIFVFLICHTLGESNSADGSHQVGWLKSEFAIQAGAHRVHMSVRKLTGTHRHSQEVLWQKCLEHLSHSDTLTKFRSNLSSRIHFFKYINVPTSSKKGRGCFKHFDKDCRCQCTGEENNVF